MGNGRAVEPLLAALGDADADVVVLHRGVLPFGPWQNPAFEREMARINPTLPEGMAIKQSYDSSVFIEGAIREVFKTLAIAIMLVISVISMFLRLGTLNFLRSSSFSVTTNRPLSVVMAEQIQYLRDWAQERTVPAD